MVIVAYIMLGFNFVMLLFAFYMQWRNNKVFIYKKFLLEIIKEKSEEDVRKNRPYQWRWEMLQSVSYNEMMLKFWKKLDDFYPDKSFLK